MGNPTASALDADGTACVALLGEIDFTNADEVAQALRDAVSDWSPPTLRVDLRAATFIDSTGLGALIEGYQAAAEQHIRFVVTHPSPAFRRVLAVSGLSELFSMTEPDQQPRHSATGA